MRKICALRSSHPRSETIAGGSVVGVTLAYTSAPIFTEDFESLTANWWLGRTCR
jgi:hypothetical protein